jgi:uncharacterized repeat protein (TIGR01451 family)/LPXTG-motif cell wall-anchored protein
LPAGADAPTLTIVAHVDAATTGSLTNQAVVSGGAVDTDPTNNGAKDPTNIIVSTDLSIVKTASAPNFDSGVSPAGTFTLQVTNNGPSVAADTIAVVDTLPAGLTYVNATGTNWSCNATGQDITCTTDADLAPGADAAPITVTVGTVVGTGDPDPVVLDNTATVSTTPGQDPNPANNSSTASVTVAANADLSITKTHPVDPVNVGEQIPFTITVHNDGPSPALGPITIKDTLPAGMSFVSASAEWTCNTSGQTVTCTNPDNLASGADAPVLLMTVQLASSAGTGMYTNTADVHSSTPDPNSENNIANDVVNTVADADLSIVKTHTGDAVIGQTVTYTLTVTNNGPSDATKVSISDNMPSSLTPLTADGAGWTCMIAAPTVGCTLPSLAAGQTSVVTLTATVLNTGAYGITNTATVESQTPDSNTSNNTSTDNIPKGQVGTFDLRLVKSLNSYSSSTAQAVYKLQVSNVGVAAHTGTITVVDQLPSGLQFVSGSGSGWTVTHSGQRVVAVTTQTVAPNAKATPLFITTKVTAQPGQTVVNSATVSGGTGEVNHTNNNGKVNLNVTPLPHTGATSEMPLLAGGLVLIVLGGLMLARRREQT